MEEAERIAQEEHQSHKILVISGVGTRHYYRKMLSPVDDDENDGDGIDSNEFE
jgi:hypothetical protein